MCIGIFRNKWQKFEPTKQYLSIVSGLISISKLHLYSQKFKYIAEKGDYWKVPSEFLNDGGGDCEDWARWYVDILVRIIGLDKVRFIIHGGKNKERWGNKTIYHAICVIPYRGKLAIFNIDRFKSGFKDYIDAGYHTFPDGLKYMEVRNYLGEILEKKHKWFGTF